MELKKKLILICIIGLLGFQFLVILIPGKLQNRRTWPFLNYPMYSGIRYPGDEIILRDLFVQNEGQPVIQVFNKDLHIMNRILKVLLRNTDEYLSGNSTDSLSYNRLNSLLNKNFDAEYAQIIIRNYKMTENGFDKLDDPIIHEHKWRIR